MRYFLMALVLLHPPYADACNQKVYDAIYVKILQDAVKTNNLKLKNQRIEALRALCEGQKSTLEHKNIYPLHLEVKQYE